NLYARNHKTLVSHWINKVPIAVELNIVKPFNGPKILLHEIQGAISIHFQRIRGSQNTLFKSQSASKTVVIIIVNITKKIEVVFASGNFKINSRFFRRMETTIQPAHLNFHRCIQSNYGFIIPLPHAV